MRSTSIATRKARKQSAPLPTLLPPVAWWEKPRNLALVLVAVVGLVFLRVCVQDFVTMDDGIQVYENPVLYPITSAHLADYWLHTYQFLYIPISYTAWALLAMRARLPNGATPISETGAPFDPHVFHTANLLLHCLNVVLVFFLLQRLTRKPLPSALGALLFGVHPIQVESVAWVAELRGLLSVAFLLGALLVHVRAVQDGPASGQRFWVREALGVLLGLLALLSKPSAAVLPLLVLTLNRLLLKQPWRRAATSAGLYALAVIPIVLLTRGVQMLPHTDWTPAWTRPFVMGDALAFDLAKLAWPSHYAVDYGRSPKAVLAHWWPYADWLIPATLAGLVWALQRRHPVVAAGALLSLIVVLPVCGLVPFLFQAFSTVADRYLYLALLGPALILAALLPERPSRPQFAGVAAVLALSAAVTLARVPVWDDTITLMSQTARVNPRSFAARNDMGNALMLQGHLDAALVQLRLAQAINPKDPTVYTNLGVTLRAQDHLADACAQFRIASSLSPHDCGPDVNLGDTLLAMRQPAAAAAAYAAAFAKEPLDPEPTYELANVALHEHRYAAAEAGFRRVMQMDPQDVLANFHLGEALAAQGKYAEARAAYERAIGMGDTLPDVQAALAHLPPS